MGLAEKLDIFENRRTKILDELAAMDDQELARRPDDDKWSIIEIIEHMVIAEREVLMGLPDPAEMYVYQRNLKNKLMLRVVMFVLGRIKVKVPSKTMIPAGGGNLAGLRAKWDESQKWFRDYVDSCDEEGLDRAVFKHPVAGPINVPQTIDMAIAHLDDHEAQIRRILQQRGG